MVNKPGKPKTLHFEVSSGLKSVLGSDLITDEEVAIFELVKNAFDAQARRVELHFSEDQIVIADNGHGMSLDEIKSRWLFVAYSHKKGKTAPSGFRDQISNRAHYAGSKGIGRFSSDRLGALVLLQTRSRTQKTGKVQSVAVDWSRFNDHKQEFGKVDVDHSSMPDFELPDGVSKLTHGTVLTITGLRQGWDRTKLLALRAALSKLINPFGAKVDRFRIKLIAPAEQDRDALEESKAIKRGRAPNLVNGPVQNFLFKTLEEKTTFLTVSLSEDGDHLVSELTDRGELIYEIAEPNQYDLLRGSAFQCQLFFLNRSAKKTFAARMGVPSVKFGSVFLFRNGFRVFPIGDEGDDWFNIDRRKQQGFARFLGTRDIIGRIDVTGDGGEFEEASSRNAGLIASEAVEQLRRCFLEHGLKRLERYVVPVTFVDKEDKDTDTVARLLTDPGRARVTAAVAKLVDTDQVELRRYSKKLIGLLDESSSGFEASLSSLRAIAEKTKDRSLVRGIEEAESRFEALRSSEEAARKQADEERKAKQDAEAKASEAQALAAQTATELAEEKKRNLFLTSIASVDADVVLNLHHQITIYAVDMQQQIENFSVRVVGQKVVETSVVLDTLQRISLLNRRIQGISKFATKANFRLESEKITANLADYVEQYIQSVARDLLAGRIEVSVVSDGKGIARQFKPIDISVVVDNLISNARKARATGISFNISHPKRNLVLIEVSDDGRGFDKRIVDLEDIFAKGFTTTDGSGLGLYHVRQVLGELNGTIEASRGPTGGSTFVIRIS